MNNSTQQEGRLIPKPVKERDNIDLIDLLCQLYYRNMQYPSLEMHKAFIEARNELESRFPSSQPVSVEPEDDGWIVIARDKKWPEMVKDEDYSENVFAIVEGYTQIQVMSYCYNDAAEEDGGGWFWANCNGDINGEADWDDDYKVIAWKLIPKIPKHLQQ